VLDLNITVKTGRSNRERGVQRSQRLFSCLLNQRTITYVAASHALGYLTQPEVCFLDAAVMVILTPAATSLTEVNVKLEPR
jgi:hypothetical protein